MQKCFGYIRVSRKKQEEGVSLEEQRDAIIAYARKHGIVIVEWFEETITAAKSGRPEFTKMVGLLRKKKAEGVVIHKIDRSARNLHDWADFSGLAEEGVGVHIAHESLDLTTRTGRLSGDIQAVVASDYIRNLRQEARKGFYGNLKKGLYPLCAPLGYINHGKGKVKTIAPKRGPLVREAFELYASGKYGLNALAKEMNARGLTTRAGRAVSVDRLSKILANPFYTGLIRIKTTGETFDGIHEPLISMGLYQRVRDVAAGRLQTRTLRHRHMYRRLFSCVHCKQTLIGERQKGHIYYRCHTKDCPTKTVREEVIDEALIEGLSGMNMPEPAKQELFSTVDLLLKNVAAVEKQRIAALNAERERVSLRLDRLIETYLDGSLDEEIYKEQNEKLLTKRKDIEHSIAEASDRTEHDLRETRRYLELAFDASLSYEVASKAKKRELTELLTSNRKVNGKEVSVELREPFSTLLDAQGFSNCARTQDVARISDNLSGLSMKNVPEWCIPIIEAFLRFAKG